VYRQQVRELFDQARVVAREQGLGVAAVKGIRFPFRPLFVGGAIRALREQRASVRSKEELVDLVRGFNHHGIAITSWQKTDEIVSLLEVVERLRPATVMEIGTASGGTLFMLTQVVPDDAVIVSVDLPGDEQSGSPQDRPAWRTKLYEGFARAHQRVHAIRADSHSPEAFETVRGLLGGRQIDFLFIDGDHTYDGVRGDFERYSPLVREGGLVAFHDIVPGGAGKHGDPGDVPAFWREIRERHDGAQEFVEDWEWGSCGIGVIQV
jgi:cephalosporin hydroxylase